MKRSLLTGALVCGLALTAVAAPALSVRPYRPEPVQFSMAAGGQEALLGKASRRGAGVVSRPLRAAKRFNAVGLTWRGAAEPGIAIRTRRGDGRWTPWTTMHTHAEDGPDAGAEPPLRGVSAPSWVGEADWIQYRASERPRGLRLRFINVRGTATAADRARTLVRRVANAGALSLAATLAPDEAGAAASQPSIVPRSHWGASRCPPRRRPLRGEVKAAIVHHTVNNNDYSRDEAPDVVLAVCLFHRNTNGWDDIGYNFLVDRFGTLYEGRAGGIGEAIVGAQAQGYNAQSTGISNLGTFTRVGQSPAALRAMARLIRWKLPLHGAATSGSVTLRSTGGSANRYPAGRNVRLNRISGHRDTGATACPGEALYDQLPELRRLVGDLDPSDDTPRLEVELQGVGSTVALGRPVPLGGTLTDPDGAPLGGVGVNLQRLAGARWRTIASSATAADGSFAATVHLARNGTLRARFPGLGELRPASSPTLVVSVRPRVRIGRHPGRTGAGSRAVLGGRVSPRKSSVYQVLQLERGGRFRTVGVKRLRVGRTGLFRGSFVPAGSGSYRYYVVAKADRVTARGASKAYVLRVARSRGGGVLAP